MKKIIFALVLCCALHAVSFAQTYNPYVSAAGIAPAPMGHHYLGGSALFSFVFGNNGTDAMPYIPNQELKLSVSLSRGVLNWPSVLQSVSGNMASYFDWSYDAFAGSVEGVQKATIPAGVSGVINVDYKPTSISYQFSPQNGFNVNIIPPPYAVGANIQSDDNTSEFTWTQLIPTPAEVSSFSGKGRIGYNELSWNTVSETNIKEFELYSGMRGGKMTKLASVPSQAENHNSTVPLNYTYKHDKPEVGNNFYQLASVDIDGSRKYYNIVNIVVAEKKSNWSIGPNPVKDKLQVAYSNGELDMVHIILNDLQGKMLRNKKVLFEGGSFTETVDISLLPSGTYLLNITDFEGYNYAQKVVKQ